MDHQSSLAERPLRRDAARNRELILEAAVEVFAERGIDAGYDEIARRAGVGVGTVYRRFPERVELVQALFESRIDEVVATAEAAAASADAWAGLVEFIEGTVERQVEDRGLKEVLFATISIDDHQRVGRDRIGPVIEGLVARAHTEGTLREDVGPSDIGVVLMTLSSVHGTEAPELWRRYLAVFLEGFRARPEQPPLPQSPPSDRVLHELMVRPRPAQRS